MPDASARRLAVFDLDGTVLVGDGPVRAYLAELDARGAVPPDATAALDAHLVDGAGAPDAYALVAGLAGRAGPEVRQEAYLASRAALHEGRVPVEAADGLAAALAARPGHVVAVLVTNAPVQGIDPLLGRLGLAGRFDAVIGDAGKPAGMPALLDRLLTEYDLAPERLLAVGDIWANDLAAAAALGGTTLLIDRHGRAGGAPTLRAATLPLLLPALARWWS